MSSRTLAAFALLALPATAGRAQVVLQTFTGLAQNDSLGFSLANCGDVDGDGVADVAAGAPGEGGGSARVYSSATGAQLHVFLFTANGNQWYGSAVAAAGDVDGDGYDDIAIGAEGDIFSATAMPFVEVRSGASGAVLRTLAGPTGSRFGDDIDAIGDWDGDGRNELIVSAKNADFHGTDSGRVYVFSGDPSVSAPLYVIDGPGASDYYGNAVAAAGDVDADGVLDFMASYIGYDSGAFQRIGRVEIFSGSDGSLVRAIDGPLQSFAGFGVAIANVGDVDGDGHPELVAGAWQYNTSVQHGGLVRLHSGAHGALMYEQQGFDSNGNLGYGVGGLGDVDSDGAPDFLIAATGANEAQVISGRGLETLYALNAGSGSHLGKNSCELGDVDGDGVDDWAISDTGFNQSRGRVRIFAGAAGNLLSYCTSGTTTNGCTPHVTPVGTPSASAATPFSLSISGLEGDKPGLIFYGIAGAQAKPWTGSASTLCVKPPLQRTKFTFPGGTDGQCDGLLVFDWDAYAQLHPGSLGQPFQAGERFWTQGWFRDPPSPKTTSLTDALTFALTP
jgi:hypothetical protein